LTEKILIRVLILLLIVAIAFTLYLILHTFFLKPQVSPQVSPRPTPPPEEEEVKEILPPPPLIEVSTTTLLEFSTGSEISLQLSEILNSTTTQEGFTRILFENTKDNSFLNLRDFLKAVGVDVAATSVEEFLKKVEDYPTLFVYHSTRGENRFGFVAEIKEGENLKELMEKWESALGEDFLPLMTLLAGREIHFLGNFKRNSVENGEFKYLDSSLSNFGICYTILKERFLLFTTSGESMVKLISNLQ